MNFSFFSIHGLFRRAKINIIDKKRILKLLSLIEKGSTGTAKEYLQHLLRQTKTDRYMIAYHLIIGNYKKPQTYGAFLEDFIRTTGSSCGHGKYNSEYSPIYWLGFIYDDKFECRFVLNTFCFLKNSVTLELEIEQKEYAHSIEGINYSKLPDSNPNYFRYSLPFHFRKPDKANSQICFSLIIEEPCNVKIYHCTQKGTRNLILQENLNISLNEMEYVKQPSMNQIYHPNVTIN